MQELDAELLEEESNGKSRTTFNVDVSGGHSIPGDLDRTFLLVEINLERRNVSLINVQLSCLPLIATLQTRHFGLI